MGKKKKGQGKRKKYKQALGRFWEFAVHRQERRQLLRDYAELEFGIPYCYGKRRKVSVRKIVDLKRADCFVCGKKADVVHHIIQLQHNGTNDKRNLVPLCNPCHGDVHPWMIDPVPDLFWSKHVTPPPTYVPKLSVWTTKRLDRIADQPRDERPRLVKK